MGVETGSLRLNLTLRFRSSNVVMFYPGLTWEILRDSNDCHPVFRPKLVE